ncbi:MAG TPA: TIGR03643 family protein [Ignavibacteriaceae bacterium]|nr:TIGR03643 family protein [Ignavibacteriaceae bacterium]
MRQLPFLFRLQFLPSVSELLNKKAAVFLQRLCLKLDFEIIRDLSILDISRIMEMAWEDRTPFEAIEIQFGLKENEVREIMRREMKSSSFKMWRKRVSGITYRPFF